MRLAAVAYEISEIPRNSVKIQTYEVQGHPRSLILDSWCKSKAIFDLQLVINSNFSRFCYRFRDIHG